MSLQDCFMSSFKGNGDWGRFLMTEEKHSPSKRIKKKKAGELQAIQPHFVPGKIIKQVLLEHISRHMKEKKVIELLRVNHA